MPSKTLPELARAGTVDRIPLLAAANTSLAATMTALSQTDTELDDDHYDDGSYEYRAYLIGSGLTAGDDLKVEVYDGSTVTSAAIIKDAPDTGATKAVSTWTPLPATRTKVLLRAQNATSARGVVRHAGLEVRRVA